MARPTPLQQVNKLHGSKDELVQKVAALIPADEGEAPGEFTARLGTVANRKLLRLLAVGERVQALGGRDGLVEKIAALKGQGGDEPYRQKLAGLPLPRLLDLHDSLARRAAQGKKTRTRGAKKKNKKKQR